MSMLTLSLVALMLAGFGTTIIDRPLELPPPRTVHLVATEEMKFDITEIKAQAGETLRIVLRAKGTLPKTVMAHNFVLLKAGTDAQAFVNASATARATGFIAPAVSAEVLASTPLAGAGETVQVTFTVPSKPGRYDFVCSFPGHFASGMRGVLTVR